MYNTVPGKVIGTFVAQSWHQYCEIIAAGHCNEMIRGPAKILGAGRPEGKLEVCSSHLEQPLPVMCALEKGWEDVETVILRVLDALDMR